MKRDRNRTNALRRVMAWLIILMIFSGGCISAAAQETGRTVKVGFFHLTGFHEWDGLKNPVGYNVEYLNKIAEKTGWKYEFVEAESWQAALQLLAEGKIDLLAPGEVTPERQQQFGFSAYSVGTEYGSLLTLDTNENLVYEDFQKFSQVKIGMVPTLVFRDAFFSYAEENNFTPNITYYKNTNALVSALNAGEVDAIAANLMVATKNMKMLGKFGPAPFYYLYQKDDYQLGQELNDALSKIKLDEPDFENKLASKYYPAYDTTPFTKSELDFTKGARELTVGCFPDRDPLSYMGSKTGQIKGINIDILNKISEKSGLTFRYVMLPDGEVTYQDLQERQIDLISGVEYSAMNVLAEGLKLTSPYLKSQKVLVIRDGYAFDTEKPATIAIISGSQTLEKMVQSQYPNFTVKKYGTMKACMEAVRTGQVDMMIQSQYAVQRFLAKPKYEGLSIIPVEGVSDQLCLSPILYKEKMGQEDELMGDSRLISILDKAISQLSDDEINEIIIRQTIERPYQFTLGDFLYRYRYLFSILMLTGIAAVTAASYAAKLRKRNFEMATASEARLRSITNNINGGVVVLIPDTGLKIAYANEGFLSLIQYSRQEYEDLKGSNYITYVHENDIPVLNEVLHTDMQGDGQLSVRLKIRRKDGSYIPALFNGTLAPTLNGEVELYCVIMDISEEVRTLRELDAERKRYQMLMEKSNEMMFDINLNTKEITISEEFRKKFGWSLPKSMGDRTVTDIMELWHIHIKDKQEFLRSVESAIQTGEGSECVVRVLKTDSTFRWCRMMYYVMSYEGERAFMVGKVMDIHESVEEKEVLVERARRDTLTGLYNKTAFAKAGQTYLEENPDGNAAVIFVDLDNFKHVNDMLGHMAGDEAIKEAAKKLQVIFSNLDLIARFGGDEFCILVKGISMEALLGKMDWMLEKMRSVYGEGELAVEVTISMGVSYAPKDGTELQELMACADKALYQAKENGRNQYALYSQELNDL